MAEVDARLDVDGAMGSEVWDADGECVRKTTETFNETNGLDVGMWSVIEHACCRKRLK